MNADLQRFVRDALEKGHSRDAIRQALTGGHWRRDEIDAALGEWAESAFPLPVPRRKAHLSAREAFLHLVMFATLYTSAFNSGAILFTLIDRWLPDALTTPWALDPRLEGLRWAVAGIAIALPVFLYTQRLIGRSLASEPEQRGSAVRRWLTYLTLFVTALVLIGDFVVVLRGFLSGELVPRFLLKAAVVALIAGVLFRHYLSDLRRDESDTVAPGRSRAWLGVAGVAGMLLTATVGLIVIGAPQRARTRELDRRRADDLQALAQAVGMYHQDYGQLPASLSDLAANPNLLYGHDSRDPVTHIPYGYQRADSLRYSLCARFDAPDSLGPGNQVAEFWRHPSGKHCFTFSVPPKRPH